MPHAMDVLMVLILPGLSWHWKLTAVSFGIKGVLQQVHMRRIAYSIAHTITKLPYISYAPLDDIIKHHGIAFAAVVNGISK